MQQEPPKGVKGVKDDIATLVEGQEELDFDEEGPSTQQSNAGLNRWEQRQEALARMDALLTNRHLEAAAAHAEVLAMMLVNPLPHPLCELQELMLRCKDQVEWTTDSIIQCVADKEQLLHTAPWKSGNGNLPHRKSYLPALVNYTISMPDVQQHLSGRKHKHVAHRQSIAPPALKSGMRLKATTPTKVVSPTREGSRVMTPGLHSARMLPGPPRHSMPPPPQHVARLSQHSQPQHVPPQHALMQARVSFSAPPGLASAHPGYAPEAYGSQPYSSSSGSMDLGNGNTSYASQSAQPAHPTQQHYMPTSSAPAQHDGSQSMGHMHLPGSQHAAAPCDYFVKSDGTPVVCASLDMARKYMEVSVSWMAGPMEMVAVATGSEQDRQMAAQCRTLCAQAYAAVKSCYQLGLRPSITPHQQAYLQALTTAELAANRHYANLY